MTRRSMTRNDAEALASARAHLDELGPTRNARSVDGILANLTADDRAERLRRRAQARTIGRPEGPAE